MSLLFRLSCGCIVLPVESQGAARAEGRVWMVRRIDRCDAHCPTRPRPVEVSGALPVSDDPEEAEELIRNGRWLTSEEENRFWYHIGSMIANGWRYMTIHTMLNVIGMDFSAWMPPMIPAVPKV
jgi:hypothetical protein